MENINHLHHEITSLSEAQLESVQTRTDFYNSKSFNEKRYIAQQINVAKEYMRTIYCNKL